MTAFRSFKTSRLYLKPTNLEDADFLLELLNTPKWISYIGDRNVKSTEDATIYIENNILPQYSKMGYGNYTVILKESNTKIGSCGLYDRKGIDGLDIGFAFLPQYEKMGYAFESANALKTAAFTIFGISKLNAITTLQNSSSQQLLERLGLRFKEIINLPGDNERLMLYTIEKPVE